MYWDTSGILKNKLCNMHEHKGKSWSAYELHMARFFSIRVKGNISKKKKIN